MIKTSNYLPFIIRPNLWPHLYRIMKRKIGHLIYNYVDINELNEISRMQSESYCNENVVDTEKAFTMLNIHDTSLEFYEKYNDTLSESKNQTEQCPYKLGGAANLSLLYQITESIQAKKVIETGVAYGWSSLSILLSISKRTKSKLWSIDLPYVSFNNSKWVGCAVPNSLRKYWELMRYADRDGLPKAIKQAGTIDLAHYDSDKSIEGRLFAYPLIWKNLRDGGILISDDIGDNMAFAYFCQKIDKKPIIIKDSNKYQGILVK
jgi:predicted O-methyltransferase YrrM